MREGIRHRPYSWLLDREGGRLGALHLKAWAHIEQRRYLDNEAYDV
jgi:hypothetical protein